MIRLRPYKDSDAQTILSWCKNETDFYKWTAGILGSYPITEKEFSFIKSLMPFTAFDESGIVGFFTLRNPNESTDELRFGFVIVDPKYRNKGYGKAMLQQGLKFAFDIYGAKKASLGVFENNISAYYCYKAVGFKDVVLEKEETYSFLGEDWKCRELELKNNLKQLEYYKNTPVLETERLILRPMTAEDAEATFIWCSDDRVNKFMPYNLYTDVSECVHWIDEIIPNDEGNYNWGIVLKENNLLIGSCSIGPDKLEHIGWGFGYNIRYDYWNRGLTTEATKKMIEYAHEMHGVKIIVAGHAVDNPASGRVMEKCGLKFDHYGEYKTFDGKETFKAKFYKLLLE